MTGRLRWAALVGAGLLGVWGGGAALRWLGSAEVEPGPRRVVILSIDCLRADRLGCYGYDLPTTPHLDRLARESVRFEQAYTSAPWTLPSHASLLTGYYPAVHGGRTPYDTLHPRVRTAAGDFRAAGCRTAGFADVLYLGPRYGLDRGFEVYDAGRSGAARVLARGERWLSRFGDREFFLFLHLFDVHGPYRPPGPVVERFRRPAAGTDDPLPYLKQVGYHEYLGLEAHPDLGHLRAAYDGEVAMVDRQVGLFLGFLREQGLYEDTLLVVTADHGEDLYDHRTWVGHGLFLTEETMRVPLLVKFPRGWGAGRRVARPVELVDVLPTLLAWYRLPAARFQDRRALLPELAARLAGPESGLPGLEPVGPVIYGECSNTGARMVRLEDWKYVSPMTVSWERLCRDHLRPAPEAEAVLRERIDPGAQLYHLGEDPGETVNRIATEPEQAAALAELLAEVEEGNRWRTLTLQAGRPPRAALTAEEERFLRSLGYLGGK